MCTAKYSSKRNHADGLVSVCLSELLEAFRTGEGMNLIQDAVRLALQELIEAEATSVIGAGRYERSEERKTERNGSRPRKLTTTAGDVQWRIPKPASSGSSPIPRP